MRANHQSGNSATGNYLIICQSEPWPGAPKTTLVAVGHSSLRIQQTIFLSFVAPTVSEFLSFQNQCHVSHSGSLLQYQCNSGPYNNGRTVIFNPVRSSSSYFSVNTWHSSKFILKPEYDSSLLKFNSCRRSFSRGPSPAPECSEDLAPNLSF